MNSRAMVYLSLGSNIQPAGNLARAIQALRQELSISKIASTWQTPPYGGSGGNYLNTAIAISTYLSIDELKNKILRPIESRLGRIRTEDKYAPRTIDLDILIYENEIIEPRLWSLPFIALPMAELIPELKNPSSGETLAEAASHFLKTNMGILRKDIQLNDSIGYTQSNRLK